MEQLRIHHDATEGDCRPRNQRSNRENRYSNRRFQPYNMPHLQPDRYTSSYSSNYHNNTSDGFLDEDSFDNNNTYDYSDTSDCSQSFNQLEGHFHSNTSATCRFQSPTVDPFYNDDNGLFDEDSFDNNNAYDYFNTDAFDYHDNYDSYDNYDNYWQLPPKMSTHQTIAAPETVPFTFKSNYIQRLSSSRPKQMTQSNQIMQ